MEDCVRGVALIESLRTPVHMRQWTNILWYVEDNRLKKYFFIERKFRLQCSDLIEGFAEAVTLIVEVYALA